MRYAAATNTGNACYSNLVDSCQHSRLREALGGGIAHASRTAYRPLVSVAAPVSVSEATKAYLWVAGMSVASLLSIVVSGTVNA